MKLYQVRVDIFEPATPGFPIVTHLFTGKSREQAWHFHEAHRKSDVFMRECEDKHLYAGSVECQAMVSEGWVQG